MDQFLKFQICHRFECSHARNPRTATDVQHLLEYSHPDACVGGAAVFGKLPADQQSAHGVCKDGSGCVIVKRADEAVQQAATMQSTISPNLLAEPALLHLLQFAHPVATVTRHVSGKVDVKAANCWIGEEHRQAVSAVTGDDALGGDDLLDVAERLALNHARELGAVITSARGVRVDEHHRVETRSKKRRGFRVKKSHSVQESNLQREAQAAVAMAVHPDTAEEALHVFSQLNRHADQKVEHAAGASTIHIPLSEALAAVSLAPAGPWDCSACTAVNAPALRGCEVCQSLRLSFFRACKPDDLPDWQCSHCMFRNAGKEYACEICLLPRTVSSLQLDQEQRIAHGDVRRETASGGEELLDARLQKAQYSSKKSQAFGLFSSKTSRSEEHNVKTEKTSEWRMSQPAGVPIEPRALATARRGVAADLASAAAVAAKKRT